MFLDMMVPYINELTSALTAGTRSVQEQTDQHSNMYQKDAHEASALPLENDGQWGRQSQLFLVLFHSRL